MKGQLGGAVLILCMSACGADHRQDAANPADRELTIAGCVGVGSSPGQYVLLNIASSLPEAPHPGETEPVRGITEGAWVRLEADAEQFRPLVGRRVEIRGTVAESGRNTIGTSGVSGYETPSGDTSQAASDAHYAEKQKKEVGRMARQSLANGTAATIRVGSVRTLEQAGCEHPPVEKWR